MSYESEVIMNIQVFGTKKSSDTRKAERFFKARGIKFQFIDLKEKELSKGEFKSVMQAVGGVDAMIDPECKDKDLLALVTYISADERADKVVNRPHPCGATLLWMWLVGSLSLRAS